MRQLNYSRHVVCCLLCFAMWLASFSIAQCEVRYDMHDDEVAPGALEFSGIIDAAPERTPEGIEVLIINDTVYLLDQNAKFRDRNGGLVGSASFKKGMTVGFFVIDNNLITKMWQTTIDMEVSPGPVQESLGSGNQPAGGDQLRLEDGVWKN